MKTVSKIVLVLLALVLVGTIWLCAHWLGRIKKLSNSVQTDAAVLRQRLNEETPPGDAPLEEFRRGQIYSVIQQELARGTDTKEYPASILQSERKRTVP